MPNLPQAILRLPIVKQRVGLSRSSIYLKIAQGLFPKPIHLGDRAVVWVEAEVEGWIKKKIEQSKRDNEIG